MVRSIKISKRNKDNVLISGVNPTISSIAVKFFDNKIAVDIGRF